MEYFSAGSRVSAANGTTSIISQNTLAGPIELWLATLSREQLLKVHTLVLQRLPQDKSGHVTDTVQVGSDDVERLTLRERDVLILIARGYTRSEMAASLGISRHTAASHIASIYRKLDICTIAEATAFAMRCGLVS